MTILDSLKYPVAGFRGAPAWPTSAEVESLPLEIQAQYSQVYVQFIDNGGDDYSFQGIKILRKLIRDYDSL